jgi:hypothetical protein
MCFNYSEVDSTKENWDRYYWEAIKRTFGFGAFIVWCRLWFLPHQLLQAYSTVFIVADVIVKNFVSWCSFTWVNVETRELVILEMDRFTFQVAAAELSASAVQCSLFHLSRTARTEFCFIGNLVSLWLYCNFKFVSALMKKLEEPHPSFFTVFMLILLFFQEWHCTIQKVTTEVTSPSVCMCTKCWCSCIYVYAWIYQPANRYIKVTYSFLSSVGCCIANLSFSCLEH